MQMIDDDAFARGFTPPFIPPLRGGRSVARFMKATYRNRTGRPHHVDYRRKNARSRPLTGASCVSSRMKAGLPMRRWRRRWDSPPSPCLRRLKALEEDGIVAGYHAVLDRKALGYAIEAFVLVKLEQSEPGWRTRLIERLNAFEEVLACYAMAGEIDLLIHVVARDMDAFGEFSMNRLLTLPGVADVRSSFVLAAITPPRGPADPGLSRDRRSRVIDTGVTGCAVSPCATAPNRDRSGGRAGSGPYPSCAPAAGCRD